MGKPYDDYDRYLYYKNLDKVRELLYSYTKRFKHDPTQDMLTSQLAIQFRWRTQK